MSSILTSGLKEINNVLNIDVVSCIATATGFIRRVTNKLDPLALLLVMVVEQSLVGTHSLSVLCEILTSYGAKKITPQALSQRLDTSSAVRFFKGVYSVILESRLSKLNLQRSCKGILARFPNVYLVDSTACSLNPGAAKSFKGTGGHSSKAGYKLHTTLNAATNSLHSIAITPSSVPDQGRADDILEYLQKGDLVLRDLGYYSLRCFTGIEERGAYFLSRLHALAKVYTFEGNSIELVELGKLISKKMGCGKYCELFLAVGKKEQLPVRLFAYRVPEAVYAERMRRLKRNAQKHGRTPSEAQKVLQRYTVLITNIPPSLLAIEEACTMYKLRWEIELVFKTFKSGFKIHHIPYKSGNRVQCVILSKLIAIVATARLFSLLCARSIEQERELSFYKFANWVIAQRYLLILFRPELLDLDLIKMERLDLQFLFKQKRTRKTTINLLEDECGYDDLYAYISNDELHTS
jgi:hypothetical protein